MSAISVIVPVYNVEQYLERCVCSILKQTFSDFELILIDDGSPDNCGKICDAFARADERIHVIHQKNGGLSAARNAGIDWAFANSNSEWLTFIDSDDWVHPQYLEFLLEAATETNADISICEYFKTSNVCDFNQEKFEYENHSPENCWVMNFGNAVVTWGKLYKKVCFTEIRFPVGKINEDAYVTHKMLFKYTTIPVVNKELYFYFQRDDSIMNTPWNIKRFDEIWALKEQMKYFEKNGYKKALMHVSDIQISKLVVAINNIGINKQNQKHLFWLRKELRVTIKKYKGLYKTYRNDKYIFRTAYPKQFAISEFIRKKIKHSVDLFREKGLKGVCEKIVGKGK